MERGLCWRYNAQENKVIYIYILLKWKHQCLPFCSLATPLATSGNSSHRPQWYQPRLSVGIITQTQTHYWAIVQTISSQQFLIDSALTYIYLHENNVGLPLGLYFYGCIFALSS